jgi:Domain of unknown function DUF29
MSDCGADVLAWSVEQAGLLRRRATGELVNDNALDWPNIAEEIESVGNSERSVLRRHIATVLEHLIKLQASPAVEPRNGWKASVLHARVGIRRTLRGSPSLGREAAAMIAEETLDAQQVVAETLAIFGKKPIVAIEGLAFTEEQVLGPWFPDEAPA